MLKSLMLSLSLLFSNLGFSKENKKELTTQKKKVSEILKEANVKVNKKISKDCGRSDTGGGNGGGGIGPKVEK